MGNKLYIGNLPYDVSEDELNSLFSQAGSVSSVKIISDRFTGKSRGFGFVEMGNDDDASKAITQFNGYTLKQRELKVSEARPETRDRDGRGGGGGGGGGGRGGYGGGGGRGGYGGGGADRGNRR